MGFFKKSAFVPNWIMSNVWGQCGYVVGILYTEGRDAAKQLQYTGHLPTTKNYQKIPKVEKLI